MISDQYIPQHCHIRHVVCGNAECIYCRERYAGQFVPRQGGRPAVSVLPPFLFSLVRAIYSSAGLFPDTGSSFSDRDAAMENGICTYGSHILILVLCRRIIPYTGRRNMRAGACTVPDKTDDGTAPAVQDRLCRGMPLCYCLLRNPVHGCSGGH